MCVCGLTLKVPPVINTQEMLDKKKEMLTVRSVVVVLLADVSGAG